MKAQDFSKRGINVHFLSGFILHMLRWSDYKFLWWCHEARVAMAVPPTAPAPWGNRLRNKTNMCVLGYGSEAARLECAGSEAFRWGWEDGWWLFCRLLSQGWRRGLRRNQDGVCSTEEEAGAPKRVDVSGGEEGELLVVVSKFVWCVPPYNRRQCYTRIIIIQTIKEREANLQAHAEKPLVSMQNSNAWHSGYLQNIAKTGSIDVNPMYGRQLTPFRWTELNTNVPSRTRIRVRMGLQGMGTHLLKIPFICKFGLTVLEKLRLSNLVIHHSSSCHEKYLATTFYHSKTTFRYVDAAPAEIACTFANQRKIGRSCSWCSCWRWCFRCHKSVKQTRPPICGVQRVRQLLPLYTVMVWFQVHGCG